MHPGMPTLGIRFVVRKLRGGLSGGYLGAAWYIFWTSVDPKKVAGSYLFEGDTGAIQDGSEVCCIVVQHPDRGLLIEIRALLQNKVDLAEAAAMPVFIHDPHVYKESLPSAGFVDASGRLSGDCFCSRPGLEAARPSSSGSVGAMGAPDVTTRDKLKAPDVSTKDKLQAWSRGNGARSQS